MDLQPHQQRVVIEKVELDEKIDKLTAFFDTPIYHALSSSEQNRLQRQAIHMGRYSTVLGEHIDAFGA